MKSLVSFIIRYLSNVSSSQWKQVLEYVMNAENKITVGADKRAWVVDKLKNIGITGWVANFLVESAVAFLKKQGLIQDE